MNTPTAYEHLKSKLQEAPKVWLITGVAGFIGSNILEALLKLNQTVVGLDNFSTGKQPNLDAVKDLVTPQQWGRLTWLEADIRDVESCQRACQNVDYVLHQAALGSVPRSIEDPLTSNASNVTGFLNMLVAARDQKAQRFVYASSSAVYGDSPDLPKLEQKIGNLLSPYAVTKFVNELLSDVFARNYGMQSIGLRYFNVFGARQDPEGPYAAVIPMWIDGMMKNQPIYINGDGETSRDFCYVANVVQVNLLAATAQNPEALNQVYNIALNSRTTLNQLFALLRESLLPAYPHLKNCRPVYRDFRPGDILHSQADISKAVKLLGYEPTHTMAQGLAAALEW